MTITEAEQTVRDALGPNYGVTKMGRYWLIGRTDGPGWSLVCQSTSLPKAIASAK